MLAFHGVSLSLPAPEEPDFEYLKQLKIFNDEFSLVRVSDHLCWSSLGGHHWHDLLPFPYTDENLSKLSSKIHLWQEHFEAPHEEIWELWSAVCQKRPDIPFMIEWDADIPDFKVVKGHLDRVGIISLGSM